MWPLLQREGPPQRSQGPQTEQAGLGHTVPWRKSDTWPGTPHMTPKHVGHRELGLDWPLTGTGPSWVMTTLREGTQTDDTEMDR